jgi:XTP/dITP diphosphohydrolase
VFVPEGYDKTFAELGVETKNRISHRAKAVMKLADFLKNTK